MDGNRNKRTNRAMLYTIIILLNLLAFVHGEATVHTVFTTECNKYFTWQSLGLMYSHQRAGQPGPLTRLMSCTRKQLLALSQEDITLCPTHIAPSYTHHPRLGDIYSAYNKPVAVLDWLARNDIKEDYILIIDADMIMRQPFLPDIVDLSNGNGEASVAGAKPGMAVSAYFGYMKGVANKLAKKHIPDVVPHNDTLAGPVGRRGDQVGGFTLMATEDLKRVAPLWLRYTEDVRYDPDAWELTGDAYSTHPGDKPWISEMYGYSFGAAKADVWHTVNHNAMLYPGYETTTEPMVLHYGLLWSIAGTEYSFDKHWHNQFDALQCPPWDLDKRKPTKGLFPYPPQPSSFNTTGFKLLRDLLSVEPIIILNKAFCEKHRQRCPPSDELTQHCAYVDWMVVDLDAAYARLELPDPCVDGDVRCKKWADDKECDTNPGFMMEQCKLACGGCVRKDGRKDVVVAAGAGDDDDDGGDENGGIGGGGMGGDGDGGGGEAGAFDGSIRNNNGVRKKVIRINNEIIVQEVKPGDDEFQRELDRMKKKKKEMGGDTEEEEELSLNDLHAKIILNKYGQKQNNTMPPNFYLNNNNSDDDDDDGSGEKVPDLEHREGILLKKRDTNNNNAGSGLDELQRVRNLIVKGSASHIRGGGDDASLDIFASASGTGRDGINNNEDEELPEEDLDVNNFNARSHHHNSNKDDDAVLQGMDRDHLIVALKKRCIMHTEWDLATLTECLELAGQALEMQDAVYNNDDGGSGNDDDDDDNGGGGIVLSSNDINSKRGWGDSNNRGSGHDLGRLVGQRLRHAHVDGGRRVMTGTAALVHRLGLLGMMLWGCGILIVACCLPRLRRSMVGGGGNGNGGKGGWYHRHGGGNGGHVKVRPYNGAFARYKPRGGK